MSDQKVDEIVCVEQERAQTRDSGHLAPVSLAGIHLFPFKGAFRKYKVWFKRLGSRRCYFLKSGKERGDSELTWLTQECDYLESIKERIGYKNSEKTKFSINVCSLMYLGWFEVKHPNGRTIRLFDAKKFMAREGKALGITDYITYFENIGQKQVGAHVVVNRMSALIVIQTRVINGRYVVDAGSPAPISSIYPVIRNDFALRKDRTRSQTHAAKLTLGLEFRQYSKNSRVKGDRHYYRNVRISAGPLETGGVFEIKDEELHQLYNDRKSAKGNRLAIYVCAGAKLVVLDQYQGKHKGYNRSLVQQGGIVVCKSQLRYCAQSSREGRDLSLKEAVVRQFLVRESGKADLNRDYENQVIFLGANESDHNSIAWGIVIHSDRAYLSAPEGGYIVAIEEWKDGISEIWHRYHYERLYLSIIRCDTTEWIPDFCLSKDKDILDKILGIRKRGWNCNVFRYMAPYAGAHSQVLTTKPIEFNFCRFVHRNSYPKLIPMPPLCPPIKSIGPGTSKLWYLPTGVNCEGKYTKFENFESHYKIDWNSYVYKDNHLYCSLTEGDKQYKYIFKLSAKTHDFDEYVWTKVAADSVFQNVTQTDMRYGADGWLYQKDRTKKIGRCRTICYVFEQKKLFRSGDPGSRTTQERSADETRKRSRSSSSSPKRSGTKRSKKKKTQKKKSKKKTKHERKGRSRKKSKHK